MLEFGKPQRQNKPSGHHSSTDVVSLSAGPLSEHHRVESKWGFITMEANPDLCAGSRVSVLQKSTGQTATRSLSATVRKKTSSSLDGPPTLQDMAKLLEAVHAENAMVDGAPRNPKEEEVGGGRAEGRRMGGSEDSSMLESQGNSPHACADLKHVSNTQALPSTQSGGSSTSSPHAVRKNSDHEELVSSSQVVTQPVHKLPIKPTLLSYDISSPSKPTSMIQRSEQQGEASNQDLRLERGERDVASQSLTVHTLKIITEKVRNMNPKYVSTLFSLQR